MEPECGASGTDFLKAKEFRKLVEFDEMCKWCQLTRDCMVNVEREKFHDRGTVSRCGPKVG